MFSIEPGRLVREGAHMRTLAGKVRMVCTELRSCASAVYAMGSSFSGEAAALYASERRIEELAADMMRYADVLVQIAGIYRAGEQRICERTCETVQPVTDRKVYRRAVAGTGPVGLGAIGVKAGSATGSGTGSAKGAGTGSAAGSGSSAGPAETGMPHPEENGPKVGRPAGRKQAGLETETSQKTASPDDGGGKAAGVPSADTAKGAAADTSGVQGAQGIDPQARKLLLAAGIAPEKIDQWADEGLSLTSDEAEKYLPFLITLAGGTAGISGEDFQAQAMEIVGESGDLPSPYADPDPQQQAQKINALAGLLLSGYPSIAMTMNRSVEVPIGPGVKAFCSVSGTGKTEHKSSLKVTETLDAHSRQLKEGIGFSNENGSVTYSDKGRSFSFKKEGLTVKADKESVAWSTGGKISEDTTYELQFKVNYETGETTCQESLTTKIEKASITTTIGVKEKRASSAPRPYPGYEKDMAMRKNMQALEQILMMGMSPQIVPLGVGEGVPGLGETGPAPLPAMRPVGR